MTKISNRNNNVSSVEIPSELKQYVESGIIDANEFDILCRIFFDAFRCVPKKCLARPVINMLTDFTQDWNLIGNATQFSLTCMERIANLFKAYTVASIKEKASEKFSSIFQKILFLSSHMEIHFHIPASFRQYREKSDYTESLNTVICREITGLLDGCGVRPETMVFVYTDGLSDSDEISWITEPDKSYPWLGSYTCPMCILPENAEEIDIPEDIPDRDNLKTWLELDVNEFLKD